ncbi:unknown [Bacillus thuringiensis phage MZTP02]|uniref:Uncharacterized protein n=1 Tax=Bacillus thuringiensis phage MZTP02 TaxID=311221 RepID=Q56AQ8_9CAUD|nr:unknown [Bacillus thuringiensis phage MZTP02]
MLSSGLISAMIFSKSRIMMRLPSRLTTATTQSFSPASRNWLGDSTSSQETRWILLTLSIRKPLAILLKSVTITTLWLGSGLVLMPSQPARSTSGMRRSRREKTPTIWRWALG